MTRKQIAVAVLAAAVAALAAVPAAWTEEAGIVNAPESARSGDFTIVPDSSVSGVWRLNSRTGEIWFCFATAQPKCYLAENAKKQS